MATGSETTPATPPGEGVEEPNTDAVAVVGSQYCAANPMDLTVTTNNNICCYGRYGDGVVTDSNEKLVMQVKEKSFSIRDRRVLLDASGKIVVTFQHKPWSVHNRWEAFRGDSTHHKDYLFSAKWYSLSLRSRVDVFLAANILENACDFKVVRERDWTVHVGDTDSVIAVVHTICKKCTEVRYKVKVFPNIDYAFMVTLIVILEQINQED